MRNVLVLATIAALSFGSAAVAAPIVAGSQINVTGGVAPIGGSNVGNATGLDFLTDGSTGQGTAGTISLDAPPSGSFSVFTLAGCPLSASAGGCGTIQDLLNFTPTLPISPFYTITEGAITLTFELDSLGAPIQSPGTASSLPFLILSGTGTFFLTGFDPTPGVFTLTTQGTGETTFSASSVTGAILPEPSTLAILGTALTLLGLARRRRAV